MYMPTSPGITRVFALQYDIHLFADVVLMAEEIARLIFFELHVVQQSFDEAHVLDVARVELCDAFIRFQFVVEFLLESHDLGNFLFQRYFDLEFRRRWLTSTGRSSYDLCMTFITCDPRLRTGLPFIIINSLLHQNV